MPPSFWYERWGKRSLDVAAALVLLGLLTPLLAVIAILVRSCLGSPVLFRQVRPGREGVPFPILKFRTLATTVDGTGKLLPDGARLTSVGRWLRSASLDELPELLNVVKGEMSLVGPRPLLLEYLPLYSPSQFRRHEVRPGITGWAQVNGRNALSWEDKFKLDVWYVDNYSLTLDLKILALTLWTVFRARGISAPGAATSPPFTGSSGRHEER